MNTACRFLQSGLKLALVCGGRQILTSWTVYQGSRPRGEARAGRFRRLTSIAMTKNPILQQLRNLFAHHVLGFPPRGMPLPNGLRLFRLPEQSAEQWFRQRIERPGTRRSDSGRNAVWSRRRSAFRLDGQRRSRSQAPRGPIPLLAGERHPNSARRRRHLDDTSLRIRSCRHSWRGLENHRGIAGSDRAKKKLGGE